MVAPALPAFAKALVIDDHPLFCDALSMTLRAFVGVAEVESADRLGAALERIDAGARPDVILLDLNLPDVDGIEGLVQLRQAARGVPVLVVSSLADARVISAALRAGAAGFIPKHSAREVFREAQRVAPERPEAWLQLGATSVGGWCGTYEDISESYAALDRFLELAGDDPAFATRVELVRRRCPSEIVTGDEPVHRRGLRPPCEPGLRQQLARECAGSNTIQQMQSMIREGRSSTDFDCRGVRTTGP